MFLKKIEIKNFRLFKDNFILDDFNVPDNNEEGTGLTLIVGENGCGKKTVLDAIGMCMLDYKASTFNIYDMNSTKMTVQVKNKTTEKKSFNIHVEAINENGERIAEDYIYANDLGAGQSQSFDIFTYVQDSKLDSMKKATFKIVDISEF